VSSDDDRAKWAFLYAAPRKDARHPLILQLSRNLWASAAATVPAVNGSQSIDEITRRFLHLVHAVARDWIEQKIDSLRVGHEDIAGFTRPPKPDDAVDAVIRGVDDCDAKARVFVALCLAGGIAAEMVPHWDGDYLRHVSAKAGLRGKWVSVELTLARAKLGDDGPHVPKEVETGRWATT
jgi:transglutaminase-like putative cysteine protease